jgi:YggT family protein
MILAAAGVGALSVFLPAVGKVVVQRKDLMMSLIGFVLGTVLLLFELLLVARMVLDWVAVAAHGGVSRSSRVREVTHRLTEPVIAPVRQVLRPIRIGSLSIDLAFTAVFVAVLILRSVAVNL